MAAKNSSDHFLAQLTATGSVGVVSAKELKARRGASSLVVEDEAPAGELRVLMARHPSGALTFHFPVVSPGGVRRGAGRGTQKLLFSIPTVSETGAANARRGLIGSVLKTVILKVTAPVVKQAMPIVGLAAESAWWKKSGLSEGWKTISQGALTGLDPLPTAKFSDLSSDPAKPNLLLLHGTFSNAKSAYAHLATTPGESGGTFLDTVQSVYEGRVFAYDHFTVSRTPEGNVAAMLAALPNRTHVVDVITHSRGGLVLRQLAELSKSRKLAVRRAVLVGAPNEGTPLATPGRWDSLVTWIANLLDLFPDNPFTTGASFVADSLGWIATNVLDGLPGLHAMNRNGEIIKALQASPGPVGSTEYAARQLRARPGPSRPNGGRRHRCVFPDRQ
jgi:hypothetical protein